VVGGQLDVAAGCARDVDAMHPDVSGENQVGEVPELPRLGDTGNFDVDRDVLPNRRGQVRPAVQGVGEDTVNASGEVGILDAGAVGDLHGAETVDERAAIGLGPFARGALLVLVLGARRAPFGRAEHVQHDVAHGPLRAVGGRRPFVAGE
jgi:hypothetical protein